MAPPYEPINISPVPVNVVVEALVFSNTPFKYKVTFGTPEFKDPFLSYDATTWYHLDESILDKKLTYPSAYAGPINQYIEETIFEAGDWDYAMVLYHLFKDKYVCSSISNKTWYVFNKNRWEKDEGLTLTDDF